MGIYSSCYKSSSAQNPNDESILARKSEAMPVESHQLQYYDKLSLQESNLFTDTTDMNNETFTFYKQCSTRSLGGSDYINSNLSQIDEQTDSYKLITKYASLLGWEVSFKEKLGFIVQVVETSGFLKIKVQLCDGKQIIVHFDNSSENIKNSDESSEELKDSLILLQKYA